MFLIIIFDKRAINIDLVKAIRIILVMIGYSGSLFIEDKVSIKKLLTSFF